MTPKKILVLLGHPDKETLCGSIADSYEHAATEAGHEVRRKNVSDLQFDPLLHKGYKVIQELEQDLKTLQEDFRWAEHVVIVYPLWWSSMPALFKGLFDRMWLPAFAFRFIKGPDGKSTMGWNRLLKGRTARVVVTLKNRPWIERFMFGDYTAELVHAILRFSGFKVRLTEVGNAEGLSERARTSLLRHMAALAVHAK
jgi:NAD(P)H dehydrogenase (quinone)